MPHKLVVPLAVVALVVPLAMGRGEPPPSQSTDKEGQPKQKGFRGFPILPPIPTADPAVRSEKEFRVPTQLRMCRSGKYVGVESIPGALEIVKVTVGKDMVTGLSYDPSLYRDGKLILSRPANMQSCPDANYAQVAAHIGEVGSKDFQPGEKYKVKLRLTLFETDIPTQHFWRPETGRYKVLWSKTLTLEVEALADGLPVGRWSVELANGSKLMCEIRKDRTASVTELLRTSTGKAEVKGGSAVIVYEDDRVERWTPVGKRMVVEHWYPAARFPSGTPILGIADPESSPRAPKKSK